MLSDISRLYLCDILKPFFHGYALGVKAILLVLDIIFVLYVS